MSGTPRTDEWQRVYVCQKYVEENGFDEGTDAALCLMRNMERELNLRNQELAALKETHEKTLWSVQIKTATHTEAPWTLLELNVPPEINKAALDVGRWMEMAGVRELWGLALRTELSRESTRLECLLVNISDLFFVDDEGTEWNLNDREQIDFYLSQTGDASAEPTDCPTCNGIGELPGNPNTKRFPKCGDCGGSGVEGGDHV